MHSNSTLSFTPVDHPRTQIRNVSFDLEHPYVEQCWSAVIGPSSVLLLRRLPALWSAEVPAVVDAAESARSLGLGSSTSPTSHLHNTLGRLTYFRLAERSPDGSGLDVYCQVPALSPRQLAQVPWMTREAHERIFDEHLRTLAQGEGHATNAPRIVSRLNQLQNEPPKAANGDIESLGR